ncbi:MAG: hypothetical protein J3R72DRAFT_499281 [Linnemannia gamsii]|nr:MAG: hypothetical protein J3R72DRAFT_499281 [Linnemannia gamsii]
MASNNLSFLVRLTPRAAMAECISARCGYSIRGRDATLPCLHSAYLANRQMLGPSTNLWPPQSRPTVDINLTLTENNNLLTISDPMPERIGLDSNYIVQTSNASNDHWQQ